MAGVFPERKTATESMDSGSSSLPIAPETEAHARPPVYASDLVVTRNSPPPSPLQNISLSPLTQETFLAFRRTTSLLLPIPYPDEFFQEAITDPVISSITRVALYSDIQSSQRSSTSKSTTKEWGVANGHVIGGIRCCFEPVPVSSSSTPLKQQQQLYVQALVLLSPYRGRGVATHLLDTVVSEAVKYCGNVTSVYAHVWEANEEGLEWYMKRGFTLEDGIVDGYYRRLKPRGARVVRRMIGIADHIRAGVVGKPLFKV
ncbi:hypothetical protein MMC14_000507 [Varicellaria rhodocarpa]|nr:hypothetical protein [Varicellaria rhodocarpa]